jgi:hypothetical protein
MTPAEIIDSLAALISAAAACVAPLLALSAALGGAYLGAYLQRKASKETQRSIRAQRSTEEITQPISDYLHYASVVTDLEPHFADLGDGKKVSRPIQDVFEHSYTSMLGLEGPAVVHVVMLGDPELLDKIEYVIQSSHNLTTAVGSEKQTLDLLMDLSSKCVVAIADAKAWLEEVKKEAVNQEQ